MAHGNWNIEGYKMLSQTWLAPDKAQVELEIEAHGGVGIVMSFIMRKIDGEWKLVVFNNRDKHGAFSHVGFADESNPLASH